MHFCRLLLFFFKINFFKKFFQEYHQSVKQFGSGFKLICKGYQIDNTRRQIVKFAFDVDSIVKVMHRGDVLG